MNKLQLFTRYYITKVERGMDQRRSRGKINISKHLKRALVPNYFYCDLAFVQNFQETLHSKDEKTSFKLSPKRNYGSLFYDRNKDN
jgi:hypothetical protein